MAARGVKTTTERRQRFEALVREAERLAERSPRAYRLRAGVFALLGYAAIFGVLAVLALLIGGTVWAAFASTALFLLLVKKKVIFVLAVMAWVLLRALWVRFERPAGLVVTAAQAPALFEEIRGLRRALALPRIHEVLITEDFNAAMAQSPRLGVLGWQRNSLILGLPLMLALTPEEMRAVVAHEAGHLSGNHGRFNGWIYRVRTTWYRIMGAFDEAQGIGVALLRRFFAWYAPAFEALSFALARANEYEADAVSVEVTSREAAASALLGSAIRGDVAAEGYWQPLVRRADVEPEPERSPYRGLARFHAEHEVAAEDLAARARSALARATDHSDTHPALRDRLAAIGVRPEPRFKVAPSAAEAWLGAVLPEILAAFDAAWLERNAEGWRRRHAEIREEREALAALEARPRETLEPLELWRLAALTETHRGPEPALALFREYAAREPEDRDADLVLGRLLLARDDPAGLHHVERATEKFVHALPACELAYAFHRRRGEDAAAELWRRRGEAQIDLEHAARAERATLDKRDTFLPAGLPEAWIVRLRDQLAARSDVRGAWIARKQVRIAPEIHLYVIAFRPRRWWKSARKVGARLAEEIEAPGECFFVPRAGETRKIAKQVEKAGTRLV